MPILDTAAVALEMPIGQAHVTIAALQAAFELNGKRYDFNKVARIVIDALKHRKVDDPDVRYAAEWLKPTK
jgi:hypothetical protein